MECPLCRQRAARRACPALGREICPVCCGTKRVVEISCPPDCRYLASAQAHPAAVVRRQQERDVAFVTWLMRGLTPRQKELTWAVLGFVSRSGGDPLFRVKDRDVADMAAAMASTFETAARGVIYEHRPQSLVAQRLAGEVRGYLEQVQGQAGRAFERDAAAVLARVAEAFGQGPVAGRELLLPEGPAGRLETVGRVLRAAKDAAAAEGGETRIEPPGPTLIHP